MRACVHRGAHEVGGTCVELEHEGFRLVLDLGRPLDAGRADVVPLPPVPGLADGSDPTLLGVLISHGHLDHWGLVPQIHPSVPRFIGRAAGDILRAAEYWGAGADLCETAHLRDGVPIQLGPFTITPYLVDHSAFDAYGWLIQAGADRLFYTGDLRGHGRKARLFEDLVRHPPSGVDVLLAEGTNLGSAGRQGGPTESGVEEGLVLTLRATSGLAVVLGSPQNVDRLVSVYRATRRTGRLLAMCAYGAEVVRATGAASIPRPDPAWPSVKAYLPLHQRVRIKTSREFQRAHALAPHRVFAEDVASSPGSWCCIGRTPGRSQRCSVPGR